MHVRTIPGSEILAWAHLHGMNVTGVWKEVSTPKVWRTRRKGWDVGSAGFTQFITNENGAIVKVNVCCRTFKRLAEPA